MKSYQSVSQKCLSANPANAMIIRIPDDKTGQAKEKIDG
jgi:hypothetical protein